MTDLACWRLHTFSVPAFVVRVYGREFTIREDEVEELIHLLTRVMSGDEEALSEGYKVLCAEDDARRQNAGTDLLAFLNIAKPTELVTRR